VFIWHLQFHAGSSHLSAVFCLLSFPPFPYILLYNIFSSQTQLLIYSRVDRSRDISIKVPKIFDKKCKPIGIGKTDYEFRLTYFGRDGERNIYISCEYDIIKGMGESDNNVIDILYKYNKVGQLVAVIEQPVLKEVFEGMYSFRRTRVDREGNVYFFRPDKNGLKIYKYKMR
jgi:hypothetical protein